ncbi:MAG: hypothetical protein N3A02_00260, partial [Rectinema sp.]|nr:hypothetical protein [Rectinema sp.]
AMMRTWYTTRPCMPANKSHINLCVVDSTWEASEGYVLDTDDFVEAWAKNDHLGCEIYYQYNGSVHKYRPDFIARLRNGDKILIEVKGQETDRDRAKRAAVEDWVRAVNREGSFGTWHHVTIRQPQDLRAYLAQRASARAAS